MGVTLSYETVVAVPPVVRSAVIAASRDIVWPNGEPWCEPLYVAEQGDGTLYGFNKVFRMSTEPVGGKQRLIDFGDDSLMAAIDMDAIFAWLHHQAEAYGLAWHLNFEGFEFGVIDRTPLGPEITEFALQMAQTGGAADLAEARRRAPLILQKYGLGR